MINCCIKTWLFAPIFEGLLVIPGGMSKPLFFCPLGFSCVLEIWEKNFGFLYCCSNLPLISFQCPAILSPWQPVTPSLLSQSQHFFPSRAHQPLIYCVTALTFFFLARKAFPNSCEADWMYCQILWKAFEDSLKHGDMSVATSLNAQESSLYNFMLDLNSLGPKATFT